MIEKILIHDATNTFQVALIVVAAARIYAAFCLNPTPMRYLLAGEHPQDGHTPDF